MHCSNINNVITEDLLHLAASQMPSTVHTFFKKPDLILNFSFFSAKPILVSTDFTLLDN